MNFEKLAYIRDEVSQKEIASILHVSRATYSKWEIGVTIIPLKHLFHFCNYFHISLDYALNLTTSKEHISYAKEPNKKTIGNRLKLFRKQYKITQKELAFVLHTTQSTISAYEKGKTLLLTAFAYQIARKYNISMDWICGRINYESQE